MQNGAQAAARCASIKRPECATDSGIKNFAIQNTMGLKVTADQFTVERVTCGVRVTGTVVFDAVAPSMGLTAATIKGQACFPS